MTLGQRLIGGFVVCLAVTLAVTMLLVALADQSFGQAWDLASHLVMVVGAALVARWVLAISGLLARVRQLAVLPLGGAAFASAWLLWPVSTPLAVIIVVLGGLAIFGALDAKPRRRRAPAARDRAHERAAAAQHEATKTTSSRPARTHAAPQPVKLRANGDGNIEPAKTQQQTADGRPARPPAREHAARTGETVEAVLAELESYPGLEEPAEQLRDLIAVLEHERERGHGIAVIPPHLVFKGAPGTGKTTIARLYGRALHAMGLLPRGHTVECDRGALVDSIIGGTALKTTRVCEQALGGVLFVDEAYELAGKGGQDFGGEVIATLMKFMEDRRGELVIIAAGYPREMDRLLDANPGLRSRFPETVTFPAYDADACVAIAQRFAAEGHYTLDADAQAAVRLACTELREDPRWANGRSVRQLHEYAVTALARRLRGQQVADGERDVLTGADFEAAAAKWRAEQGTPAVSPPGGSVSAARLAQMAQRGA